MPPAPPMPEPKLASPRSCRIAGAPDFADRQRHSRAAAAAAAAAARAAPKPPHCALKTSLTPEMVQNFDLFIYVSKADRGPLAQRMYVFRKQAVAQLEAAL